MTMVLATHEMSFAREVADQACFLDGGRVIEAGPPQRVLGQPTELGRGSSCTGSSKAVA